MVGLIKQNMAGRSAMRKTVSIELIKTKYQFTIMTRVSSILVGNGFGELALMPKKGVAKRAATIVCDGDVEVAWLDKDAFNKSIKSALERKINDRIEFLSGYRLTGGITRNHLQKLTQYLFEKSFRRRDVVYKEKDICDGVYFIRNGEFEVN